MCIRDRLKVVGYLKGINVAYKPTSYMYLLPAVDSVRNYRIIERPSLLYNNNNNNNRNDIVHYF